MMARILSIGIGVVVVYAKSPDYSLKLSILVNAVSPNTRNTFSGVEFGIFRVWPLAAIKN